MLWHLNHILRLQDVIPLATYYFWGQTWKWLIYILISQISFYTFILSAYQLVAGSAVLNLLPFVHWICSIIINFELTGDQRKLQYQSRQQVLSWQQQDSPVRGSVHWTALCAAAAGFWGPAAGLYLLSNCRSLLHFHKESYNKHHHRPKTQTAQV